MNNMKEILTPKSKPSDIAELPGEKRFHVDFRKYIRLYFIIPPLFTLGFYYKEAFSGEGLGFLLLTLLALHLLYKWRVYEYFVVVVGPETLQLYDLLGQSQEIAYTDMIGPLEKDFKIVKYYSFVSANNPNLKLVITDYTEHIDACIALIKERMAAV